MEKVAVLQNEPEAMIIEQILNEENIPHLVKSYFDGAYGNLFQLGERWGELQCQPEDKQRVLSLLKEVRKAKLVQE